jgi:Holliday junction resolvasome RuvABC endonuclease subunit
MSSHRHNSRILAIDPGIRKMGIAFFDSGELIYHLVKVFPKKETLRDGLGEVRKVLLRLIRDFNPKIIVVEKSFLGNYRNTFSLNILVKEVKAIGKRKKLKVIAFAPTTVKKQICGNCYASKKEVARAVTVRYPELKVYLTQNRLWKEKHHQNMFDAVALGITLIRDEKA